MEYTLTGATIYSIIEHVKNGPYIVYLVGNTEKDTSCILYTVEADIC